jgi:methyl-accepting chemotaxis protein
LIYGNISRDSPLATAADETPNHVFAQNGRDPAHFSHSIMKLKLSIFHKLLVTLLFVSLVPLCALWYLGQASAKRDLNANIAQNLVSTANTIATGINAWDDTNVRALRQASRMSDIISMQADRQNPILTTIGTSYEWSYLLFTVAPDGANIGRNDGGSLTNYGDRAYFKDVAAGSELGRQVVIGKSSGTPALILAAPVRNESRDLVGVIAMAMHLTDVSQTVANARIGKTGRAILLDGANKVIAHGATGKVKTALQDFSGHPALKAEGIYEGPALFMDKETEMVGLARKLPQGWTLLIEQEYEEAYEPLARTQHEARVLIAVAVLLVMGIAFLLGKQLTQPIRELTKIATELSNGRLDVAIPQTARTDEIGALASAIERLGISMQMAMDRLRKKS